MLPLSPGASLEERAHHSRQMLLRALNLKTTIAVVGSGCSVPLGYPAWTEFTRDIIRKSISVVSPGSRDEGRLRGYIDALEASDKLQRTDLMMSFIGVCQEVLKRADPEMKIYGNYIFDTFSRTKGRREIGGLDGNPYKALLGLPIHRFVTTNYDMEIEYALTEAGRVGRDAFVFPCQPPQGATTPGRRLSFTQRNEYFNELALFPFGGIRENRNMVFHCHGRYDDPDSIIASEHDYQQWYLLDDDSAVNAFRQSIELLLASNPLLFVGYGLQDEDLLRPLRRLVVMDPTKKPSRPIFALLEVQEEDRVTDPHRHEMLYERYGLHVIAYHYTPSDHKTRGHALCAELAALATEWKDARQNWLKKPEIRRPRSALVKPEPYCDISVTSVPFSELPGFEEAVLAGGIIRLQGPSGYGKTARCLLI
jgi:hypothetical protein